MDRNERLLLKRLAEAHAFIYDLRNTAIANSDVAYMMKTSGIEEVIEAQRKKYPRVYAMYFNRASVGGLSGKKKTGKVPKWKKEPAKTTNPKEK